MPTSLMKQLQHIAIDQDTTTTNIMIEAAREYIEKRGKAENK